MPSDIYEGRDVSEHPEKLWGIYEAWSLCLHGKMSMGRVIM